MSHVQYVDQVMNEMIVQSAIKHRRVYLSDEVDRESIFKCIYYMEKIKYLDDMEKTPMEKRKPIEIVLDCYGGVIYHGNALIGKIEEFQKMGYEVNTTVNSVAMSMGFMVLISGTRRKANKYATLLCHQPSSSTWGTLQNQEDDVKETRRLWNLMKSIIIDKTNVTNSKLEAVKKSNKDWIITPELALELGIIDEII